MEDFHTKSFFDKLALSRGGNEDMMNITNSTVNQKSNLVVLLNTSADKTSTDVLVIKEYPELGIAIVRKENILTVTGAFYTKDQLSEKLEEIGYVSVHDGYYCTNSVFVNFDLFNQCIENSIINKQVIDFSMVPCSITNFHIVQDKYTFRRVRDSKYKFGHKSDRKNKPRAVKKIETSTEDSKPSIDHKRAVYAATKRVLAELYEINVTSKSPSKFDNVISLAKSLIDFKDINSEWKCHKVFDTLCKQYWDSVPTKPKRE